jgi:hypothetical protein
MLDKYVGLLMYLSMVDKHIIFVKSKGNVFNDATFFNANASSCNGDVLMNSNIIVAWSMV